MTITQKQRNLQYLGYYKGDLDGKFGPLSKQATKDFQKDYGLDVDGSFGPKTIAKMSSLIKEIQKALNTRLNAKLGIDGVGGPNTRSATKTFQKSQGIVQTGLCDKNTMDKLLKKKTNKEITEDICSRYKSFRAEEFKCKCGGKYCDGYPVPISEKLVSILQRIHDNYNASVNISSGIRCQKHNDSLKGSSKTSHHLKGQASDFKVTGVNVTTLLAYCKKQKDIAYCYTNDTNMKNTVHINI